MNPSIRQPGQGIVESNHLVILLFSPTNTMLLIPTFFTRTTFRILLLQSFLAWLWIHLVQAPLPLILSITIGTTIGASINTLKITLDNSFGFPLPWETPYFLPSLLDEYILATMPDLAILLGEPPCSTKIARLHPETKTCEQRSAYACEQHAVGFEGGTLELKYLRACYEDYGVSNAKAQNHHKRCHSNTEILPELSILACTRAKQQIEKSTGVCFYIPPIIDCTIQYSKWDLLQPMTKSVGFSGKEHLEMGACERRIFGDKYIVDRFRWLKFD